MQEHIVVRLECLDEMNYKPAPLHLFAFAHKFWQAAGTSNIWRFLISDFGLLIYPSSFAKATEDKSLRSTRALNQQSEIRNQKLNCFSVARL
jgi:hypothetical protein